MPGVGFGVVATNCLARSVSDAVGGAETLEVVARVASAEPGPGVAATRAENIPFGGWIRQGGQLQTQELGWESLPSHFPMATLLSCRSPPVTSRRPFRPPAPAESSPTPRSLSRLTRRSLQRSDLSILWVARATGGDGTSSEAWLETGESYRYTAMIAVRAVEETLDPSRWGIQPGAAFGRSSLSAWRTSEVDLIRHHNRRPDGRSHGRYLFPSRRIYLTPEGQAMISITSS